MRSILKCIKIDPFPIIGSTGFFQKSAGKWSGRFYVPTYLPHVARDVTQRASHLLSYLES